MNRLFKELSYYKNMTFYLFKKISYKDKNYDFQSKFESLEDFSSLCRYIFQNYSECAIKNHTRVFIPGPVSCHGRDVDSIEGVTRLLPLLSSWQGVIPKGKERDEVLSFIRSAVINGTGTESGWGRPTDNSQLLCEAADVAIALWISKEDIWDKFSTHEIHQVSSWLESCVKCRFPENNWLLFKLIIEAFLVSNERMESVTMCDYEKIKRNLYLGDGIFLDGKNGSFDYYNNWAFIYSLFWIDQILPTFDRTFINEVIEKAACRCSYMLGSQSLPPFFGRSIIYRLAHSCPLFAHASISGNSDLSIRVLKDNYRFFTSKGAFRNGRLSYGYFGDAPSYLDDYSGVHSSLWGFRSLILAFYLNAKNHLCFDPEGCCLPIEKNSYVKKFFDGAIVISGDKETGITQIKSELIKAEKYDRPLIKNIFKIILFFRFPKQGKRREFYKNIFDSQNGFYEKI
ncbi:DUF2264 domain-containing protein [Vibrio fluvialis]|nr:DUF2264 domain-containing protein [Vibrio fluvialis]MBY8077493.1 DUF2264 domain-containing protein [Vibrio fluvialis]MBY8147895.1 DUF2264 domain-containing protein [Vibrio fluvialis]